MCKVAAKLLLIVSLSALASGCAVVDHVKSSIAIDQAERAYVAGEHRSAATAYRTSAEAGGGYGSYMLAWMYLDGEGVPRSQEEGRHWMQRAANQGYPAANYTLGVWSLRGMHGVKRDDTAGVIYLRKAADANDSDAMFLMGMLYARGMGVQADAAEALHWFELAEAYGYEVDSQLLTPEGVSGYMRTANQRAEGQADQRALVRSVQEGLATRGYQPGPVDGIYGARTKAAIESFQRDHGLDVNGQVTPALRDLLLQ